MIFIVSAIIIFFVTLFINENSSTGKGDIGTPIMYAVIGSILTNATNGFIHGETRLGSSSGAGFACWFFLQVLMWFWFVIVPLGIGQIAAKRGMEEYAALGVVVIILINVIGFLAF